LTLTLMSMKGIILVLGKVVMGTSCLLSLDTPDVRAWWKKCSNGTLQCNFSWSSGVPSWARGKAYIRVILINNCLVWCAKWSAEAQISISAETQTQIDAILPWLDDGMRYLANTTFTKTLGRPLHTSLYNINVRSVFYILNDGMAHQNETTTFAMQTTSSLVSHRTIWGHSSMVDVTVFTYAFVVRGLRNLTVLDILAI
jgi:hypothetical protein